MKKTMFSLTVLLSMITLCFAANIDGDWTGKFEAQYDVTLNLKVDGKLLTGSVRVADNNPISENPGEAEYSQFIAAQLGENLIMDGKINGDEFSFTTNFNDTKMNYKGKIETDKITLTVNFKGQDIKTTLRHAK
jgi:hypothetical protein